VILMRAFLVTSLLALAQLVGCERGSGAQSVSKPPAAAPQQSIPASRRTAITEAVARVAPAVVTVQTEIVQRVPADVFEQFFGGRSTQRVQPGLGSGFITRDDGVIVTTAHVVSGASRVSVMMRDGTTFPAKVLGVDEVNDLAVVKIDAKDLPIAPLGDSRSVVIGEWAIAIGNPFGFLLGNPEPSVSAGVISATGRNLVGESEGGGVYLDMIQTDASINPGNSGGPLVDGAGEVIGVNTIIYSQSGGSVGLGFAIPINRVKRIVDDLIEHGSVRRPWIGAKLEMKETGNPRDVINAGAVVRRVVPGSPADRAGIRAGDVIVSARGRALRNPFDWQSELLDLRVGERVSLVIRRGGSNRTVDVTVADLPEVTAPRVEVLRGLELATLTPQLRADRGVRSPRGAVLVRISDRIAQEIDLQPGDVIVQINRAPIASAEDVARAFSYLGGRAPMRVYFERGGQILYTDLLVQ
jgi:serine protease Do